MSLIPTLCSYGQPFLSFLPTQASVLVSRDSVHCTRNEREPCFDADAPYKRRPTPLNEADSSARLCKVEMRSANLQSGHLSGSFFDIYNVLLMMQIIHPKFL